MPLSEQTRGARQKISSEIVLRLHYFVCVPQFNARRRARRPFLSAFSKAAHVLREVRRSVRPRARGFNGASVAGDSFLTSPPRKKLQKIFRPHFYRGFVKFRRLRGRQPQVFLKSVFYIGISSTDAYGRWRVLRGTRRLRRVLDRSGGHLGSGHRGADEGHAASQARSRHHCASAKGA